ncbi:tRNA (N6-isopentenyl adenosine(37)-C2)-methylthiotransferase MiaB [Blattabacterium cuenoti]|uniref:tRNA (N6-isopentenyl adenosine(37)-C2)-methylthiotransferase MiaB n=1 Tax=Blattabacterium cuenoti TaxID=1653831 RepID=UPI00163BD2D7|nr:tRNA (N6-isopentenyl adenosine(37)-C2)-methylthiotransferase MiaB [Blattabacterium cuenoti]
MLNTINNNLFYIETYGCQMNSSDSEIIISILLKKGFYLTYNIEKANIILLNTCAIREKAKVTIINRLQYLKSLTQNKNKIFGIIGCLSKIENEFVSKKLVDFSINPNSYKEIPNIINYIKQGKKINFYKLNTNKTENYENIYPFRQKNKVTAFLSIIRGCNNMCTFCIVPFTRGRESSRNPYSILTECKKLYNNGYKEITLLGQNVDSYLWIKTYNNHKIHVNFAQLLNLLATHLPFMRIRFTTSNPHDFSDEIIQSLSRYSNICKHIHLPVQSGSNKMLKLMNRQYTREHYILLIKKIKKIIPECSISHDIMTGFCHENEEDHKSTISLMNQIKYHYGYMFMYSPRPGTYAYRQLPDNVPYEIKKRRLQEIITLQKQHSYFHMKQYIGHIQEVLIEGCSKKNNMYLYGKNTQNITVVFPKKNYKIGNFVYVKILDCTSATLIGNIIKYIN